MSKKPSLQTNLIRFISEVKNIIKSTPPKIYWDYILKIFLNIKNIISTKTLNNADLKMKGKMCDFQINKNITMHLEGKYFGGAREIICRNVYCFLPGFNIGKEDIVVDLGANVGIFTTFASLCASKVISVEAQSGFLPIIESNLVLNACRKKCEIEFAIVGSESGILADSESYKKASHLFEEPPSISFNAIIKKHNIEKINFLKIDIEGSEFSLFKENTEWLNIVDRIAMEVHLDYGNVADLKTKLEQYGFNMVLVDNQQNIVGDLISPGGYLFGKSNK